MFQPLTHALGTEGRVRVLRVLASAMTPLEVSALAEQTGLTGRGVRYALRELEELGVVAPAPGTGQQVSLREAWPLTQALYQLFDAEAKHRAADMAALRDAVVHVTPPPIGVWIAGPHAAGTDTPTDPLLVVCYGYARDLPQQTAKLTHALAELSRQFDLPAPEVRALDKADVELAKDKGHDHVSSTDERLAPPLRLLAGTLPALPWLLEPHGRARTHADHDDAALVRARVIAELLRRSPDLVARARSALDTRRVRASARLRPTLEEWSMLLEQPPARLAALLVRDDDRMRRLRQTLPFLDALTPSERAQVEDAVQKRNAAVHGALSKVPSGKTDNPHGQ
jgi:hypothetical protein